MRLKLGIGLAAFSMLLLLYMIFFAGRAERLYDISVSEEEFERIKAERSESEDGLIDGLFFDDEKLFFDKAGNTFYYSIINYGQNEINPHINRQSANVPAALAFLDEKITAENIRENHAFRLIAYNEDFYSEYQLKCTLVPIMNINCDSEIDRNNAPMDMLLFDNGKNAAQRLTVSEGNIHLRGATTSVYPKKSFRISLTQKSLGDNQRKNKVSLLGMRQDDDWILYPAYNDQEKIRNVFSSNLWKYACAGDNSFGIDNGMEYKYIELFMNGEYWGLYALGYPIDERQLEIDYEKDEHLYKKITWDLEEVYYSVQEGVMTGYRTTETGGDDWSALKQYYADLYSNRQYSKEMYKGIDIDNAIDMLLFVNLIQGVDHVGGMGSGSSIKNMYLSIKSRHKDSIMLYTPWDMDMTWGNSGEGAYDVSAEHNLIMRHGNLQALIENGDKKIWKSIFAKYKELRQGGWSEENINSMLDEYEEDIYGSGAYLRDMERWPDGIYAQADKGLETFRDYVFRRLEATDKYYEGLENDIDNTVEINTRKNISCLNGYAAKKTREALYGFMLEYAPSGYGNLIEADECGLVIEILDKNVIYKEKFAELVEGLGIDRNLITADTDFIIVRDIGQECNILDNSHISDTRSDTVLGAFGIFYSGENTYGVYLDGNECFVVSDPAENENIDIRVVAVRKAQYGIARKQEILY